MKKIILIYFLLTIYALSPLTTLAEEITCEENVLREFSADERRFQGVHNIARLIEAYYDATGFYPGTKGWEDSKYEWLIVRIADQDLPEDLNTASARPRPDYSPDQLLADLRKVLGNDVELPYDKSPVRLAPFCYTYYLYTWNGQCYYVSVNMDFPYEQTRTRKNTLTETGNCNTYQVSSCEFRSKKIRRFKDIDPEEKLIPLCEKQR
jgi:hypothetical protein